MFISLFAKVVRQVSASSTSSYHDLHCTSTKLQHIPCSNVACYLYPAYASYKALSLTPVNSQDATVQTERWLMYWAVVGCWTAIESVAWWLLYVIPFYSLIKCSFFLWLSLPQFEGSTYVYNQFLAPVFAEHEYDIDSFLASLQGRAGSGMAALISWAWAQARSHLNLQAGDPNTHAQSGLQSGHPRVPSDTGPQPPTMHDPASGVMRQAMGLATRYAGNYAPVIALAWQNMTAASARVEPTRREVRPEEQIQGFDVGPAATATTPSASPRYPTFPPTPPFAYAGEQSSQAMRQAASQMFTSSRQAPQQNLHQRGATSPADRSTPGSRSSSGEDIRPGRVSSRGSGYNSWGETSTFEQVSKDDVAGFEAGPERPRPSGRGSSWFGWTGATPPKGKTD